MARALENRFLIGTDGRRGGRGNMLLGLISGLKIEDRPLTVILGHDADGGTGMAQVAPLVLGLRHLDGGDDAGNFLLRPLKPVGAPQPVDVPAVAFKDGLPQAVRISG